MEICNTFNGNLVTIHDMFSNVFVVDQAKHFFQENFWFGLMDLMSVGNWSWIDGTPTDFLDWDRGQPKKKNGYDCGAMILSSGRWMSDNCLTQKNYVCLIQATNGTTITSTKASTTATTKKVSMSSPKTSTPTTSSTPTSIQKTSTATFTTPPALPGGCPSTWTFFNVTGFCYKVVMKEEGWEDARNFCKSVGGDLVSIHSEAENTFVSNLVPPSEINCKNAEIGLRFDTDQGKWTWTDNTYFDVSFWAPKYPKNGQKCGISINSKDCSDPPGLWATTYCEEQEQSICKMRAT
uniref:C-type lectin domain-containing protein n=1 Tax=Panagrolaimus sp. ES5 TaxID=591445 RepID=A0AC34GSL2_9BILA